MLGRNHETKDLDNPRAGTLRSFINPVETSPEKDKQDEQDGLLDTDEKRRLFVQISALHGMDIKATHSFGAQFIFGNEVTIEQTRGLIYKYKNDILNASSALNIYVTEKFDHMTLLKRAAVINSGLKITAKIVNGLEQTVDKLDLENSRDQDRIEGLALRNKQMVDTYSKWNIEREKWMHEAEDMLMNTAFKDTAKYGDPEQKEMLDVTKITSLMRRNGVDSFMADKIAGLIVAGDFFINEKDKANTNRYFDGPTLVGEDEDNA